jgi:hypothetical protein
MLMQCCGSGINNPDPNFSIPDPGSKIFRIPYPDPNQRILVIRDGMFIPDPDLGTIS